MISHRFPAIETSTRLIPDHPPGPPPELRTLTEVVQYRARHTPDQTAFIFLEDGEREGMRLTYGELDRHARSVAAELQQRGATDERVLLLCQPGFDFVTAIFGCLYAGALPVPAYPPDPMRLQRTIPRLQAIVKDADARFVLGSPDTIKLMPQGLGNDADTTLALPQLQGGNFDDCQPYPWDEDDTALLQYTSGSTGTPRGVMVRHRNIMHCLETMHHEDIPDVVGLSWLPPYHDMGLISCIFLPVYSGRPIVLMSPISFLERPVRWLRAVSHYRVKSTIAPNFGYDLCTRKIRREDCAGLDLSSWMIAVVGAEPVRPATLDRFAEMFAPHGFRRDAFMPGYGLAEAVLSVTAGHHWEPIKVSTFSQKALEENRAERTPDSQADARTLVGCGKPWPGHCVLIVDPKTCQRLDPGQVGEVWIQSPSVTAGYWNRADETKRVFGARLAGEPNAGVFLRTGDLGFFDGGELYITGRLKEVIILAGRNYYPQDIEHVVAGSHTTLRPDGGAALSCDIDGAERLVVVQEARRSDRVSLDEVMASIRQELASAFLLAPHAIVLIAGGSLPRTSSGKIQRRACCDMFLNGELKVLAEWRAAADDLPGPASSGAAKTERPFVAPETPLQKEIAAVWRDVLGVERISVHDNFFEIGGQSLMIMQIFVRLKHLLPPDLSIEKLFERPTIAGLADLVLASALEQHHSNGLGELLKQLEAMSDEEAQRFLETRGRAAKDNLFPED